MSGALFPISNLPSVLKTVVYINPLSYGVEGIRYGLLEASTINPLFCFLVLTAFSLIMILIGAYSFERIKF